MSQVYCPHAAAAGLLEFVAFIITTVSNLDLCGRDLFTNLLSNKVSTHPYPD